jgi:hypothetical protein
VTEKVLGIHALFQNGKHPSQQRLESFNSVSFADVDLDWDGMGALEAYVTVVADEGVRLANGMHGAARSWLDKCKSDIIR